MFIGNSHAFSSSILYFSIVHITNTQNIPTSQPFQQMINLTINSTNSKYINQTGKYSFQNVEFFNTTNGSVIDSWLEDYTSKYAIFWIKLPNGIPANTTLTDIAIGFASNTTNLFNNKTTGEAPQLSPTYAEYDDGANVFTYYSRFGGSSLPTGWSGFGSDYSLTYNKDYLTIVTNDGGSIYGGIYTAIQVPKVPSIYEFYGNLYTSTFDFGYYNFAGVLDTASPTESPYDNYSYAIEVGSRPDWDIASGNDNNHYDTGYPDQNLTQIYGLAIINSSSAQFFYNYSATPKATGLTPEPLTSFVFSGSGGSPEKVYWYRVRSYPPNAVMPSITVGHVESSTYILSLNGSFNANSTITYGTESDFTGLSHNSSVFVRLFINNTKVTNYSKNSTKYTNILAAGLYKVTAQYNSTAVENITYYERINKAIPSIQLYSLPSKNYTQNGTYLRFNFSISSLNNQLTGRFYLNKTNKVNTSTATDYNVEITPVRLSGSPS